MPVLPMVMLRWRTLIVCTLLAALTACAGGELGPDANGGTGGDANGGADAGPRADADIREQHSKHPKSFLALQRFPQQSPE